jgi:uncharacterized membrane-anchored protein
LDKRRSLLARMPLEIGNYRVALRPVFLFSALTGAFPAKRGSARGKFNLVVMIILNSFLLYAMYRFFYHFSQAWKVHDRRYRQ